MDRRIQNRIPSHTKVRLYFNGNGRMDGRLNDFSQGGVYVCLDRQYHMPEEGDIVFMLAENMDEPYTMEAVRCDKKEIALIFKD